MKGKILSPFQSCSYWGNENCVIEDSEEYKNIPHKHME